MKVNIKQFAIDMEVKNSGIEFEVRNPNGSKHLGDLVLTKSGLIWCPGQTQRLNGHQISWEAFIKFAQEYDTGK